MMSMQKWDKYALTMNINRKDIVLSKYVFFIMSIIIGMVVGVISSMTINKFYNRYKYE